MDVANQQQEGELSPRVKHAVAVAVVLAGLAVAIWLGVRSQGAFYHDDDINHYLFAVKGWNSPLHLWHTWGRPGYTVPTMLVAHFFGMAGCRVFSALQMALVALLAYLIARRLGAGWAAVAAPVLVWVQPLAMTLSLTTLTETPAAVYMTLAVWLLLRGNFVTGCAAASLLFVTRYETAALAPVLLLWVFRDRLKQAQGNWSTALRAKGMWASAVALAWAPVAYIAISHGFALPTETSMVYMLLGTPTDEYGHGTWAHYLEVWPIAAGVGVLALAAAGAVRTPRRTWLPAALAAGLVALHTVLFHYGKFASGGYPRFLVVECGLVAALAANGLYVMYQRGSLLAASAAAGVLYGYVRLLERRAALLWPYVPGTELLNTLTLAAMILLLATVAAWALLAAMPARRLRFGVVLLTTAGAIGAITWQAKLQIRPLKPETDSYRIACAEAMDYVAGGEYRDHFAMAGHVLVGFARPNTYVGGSAHEEMELWEHAAPGTLFFWDNKFTGPETPEHPRGELYDSLWRLGDRLYCCSWDEAEVEVFIRRGARDTTTTARGPGE